MDWSIYILKCADGTLYTGITNDPTKRLKQHNSGKGAKYTATRLPVEMVWVEAVASRSEALKREFELKQLTRAEKLQLILG